MKILLITHRIPYPPDKGDKIRSWHLLASLVRKHQVDLVTHVDDMRDLRHRHHLEDLCHSVSVFPLNPLVGRMRALSGLCMGTSLSVCYMTRRAARLRVARLLRERQPDLVVAYSAQSAAYLPAGGGAPPWILDLVDVDSQKWADYGASKGLCRGWLVRHEARRLTVFERCASARAAVSVVTTEQERQVFLGRVGTGDVVVITNGVGWPDQVPPTADRDGSLMLFVGTMDYSANIQAAETGARDILPRVRAVRPEARFRIVGRHPVREVRRLAELPGVEVTGEVPDLSPHLQEAGLALFPLRVARGIQNKVLEALANGIPAVATRGVLACLGEEAASFVAAGNGPEELASAALSLMGDPCERERRARRGRDYVRRRHDWRRVEEAWDELILQVAQNRVPVGQRS